MEDTNKERLTQDREIAKTLGTIQVELWHGNYSGYSPYMGKTLHNQERFQLAEKAMKGREISHGTT